MAIGDVTRLTSANIVIEFQPAKFPRHPATTYAAYDVPTNHVTVLNFNGALTGTIRLAVDGYRTAVLNLATILAMTTEPTPAEGIKALLDALPNVATGDLLVTSSTPGTYTITAAAGLLNKFLVIEILDATGNAVDTVTQTITSQGSSWYRLDGEVSDFSYTETQEAVDVTGISEKSRRESSTVEDATWELSVYEALQDYRAILKPGVEGYLRVFEDGKAVGKRFFAWEVLLKEAGSSMSQFEKIEINASGRRQGADIYRVGSHYA